MAPRKPRTRKTDYIGKGYREGEDPDTLYARDDPFAPQKGAKKGVGTSAGYPPFIAPPPLGKKRGRLSEKKAKKK